MSRTALFSDELFLAHDTGDFHPESARRLEAILDRVSAMASFSEFEKLERRLARVSEIALIHDLDYISFLEPFCRKGGGYLDADTPVSLKSYDAALLAAGSGLQAADDILSGRIDRAVLLVRPPGHHSLRNRGMGFCLFNNIAITAKYLREKGLERVAILDWDVHHGNGTQAVFYTDPSVLFISLHQYPFYPGTGDESETGEGEGTGATLNVPLSAGRGDSDYTKAYRAKILPKLEIFAPQIILISAGYDAHADDPLAGMRLSTDFYAQITGWLREYAQQNCGGRIISFLEGGYNLQALAESVEAHAAAML